MKTNELRKTYLDFFKTKDHKIYASDSLVPTEDPSLLFTGAGMNQFKPYFLGLKKDVKRATSCQKCLRAADLEQVGKTAYHHTFFEMLGNFSFGDYFKEEAITWGWEFVTKVLGLPQAKLWVSVYKEDEEAFNIWKTKIRIPGPRLVKMDAIDNFWPSNAQKEGPNGPCGPCSEIYVGEIPGRGVEIWNLVFTQFDRQSDGSLKNLPQKNIDTGMGLERTAAVLQGVECNFDTDNFQKIRAALKNLLTGKINERAHENAAMDHLRAVVFSIADGALPSNEGRGYVIRKLIRLGSDHFEKAGALELGTLHKMVPAIIDVMKPAYPDLLSRQKNICSMIENEENSYLEVIKTRMPQLKQELPLSKDSAKTAFKYYDTYGLPWELIQSTALELGVRIDQKTFESLLEGQKKRSREKSKIVGEIFGNKGAYHLIDGLANTVFTGYEKIEDQGKLLRIIKGEMSVGSLQADEEGILIFDKSPFYAESGGQMGDLGTVLGPGFKAKVLDTQWIEKCAGHKVKIELGAAEPGKIYTLAIDTQRRGDIMKNHTGTHLLHSALRKVLGDHVKQSGSLVAPDRLRFDFTHFNAVSWKEIQAVEALVNNEIHKNIPLDKKVMSKEKALETGAMAFFGEKYGDEVRVISAGDFSRELCGGTHLDFTGEIGLFKIVSESSVQAGVRRVEAVTGRWAKTLLENQEKEWKLIACEFNAGEKSLQVELRAVTKCVKDLESRVTNKTLNKMKAFAENSIKNGSVNLQGIQYFKWIEPLANTDLFTKTYEYLKNLNIPFVIMWQCESLDKITFVVGCSPDIVKKGFHSGKIVKEISKVVRGNGGGRSDFAVGGGKDTTKIEEALALGEKIIKESLMK